MQHLLLTSTVSLRVIAAVITTMGLAGCSENAGPPVPLRSFVLHDVQGLYGGEAIWASEDRIAFVQIVVHGQPGQSGLQEKRYKIHLTDDQWKEVERLVGEHRFLKLEIKERPGIPDESHPLITINTSDGSQARVKKRGDHKNPRFDAIYWYLRSLCKITGEPVYEGSFDWKWRPEGFDSLW